MKIFAVILALAVLSGCHAKSVFQAEERSSWEVAVDKFRDYFTDLNSKADEMVNGIKSSQISRELDTLIQDSMSELAMYKDDLEIKLGPYTQESAERLRTELEKLFNKLHEHMLSGREQMLKYSEELQTVMEQNADDIKVRVSAYTRKMKKRLNKDTQEIKKQVANYFEEFQSRTSDNMEEMKARFDPFFAQMRDNAQAKITTLNDLLRSQVDSVKDKIRTKAEDIKERFEKTAEDLRSTLEDKMEELSNWFQPFVSMMSGNM